MNDIEKKKEDVHNGIVDIYRFLENKNSLNVLSCLSLLNIPSDLNRTISIFESETKSEKRKSAQNEVLQIIDDGEMFIKTLVISKSISKEQADCVLDDMEILRELISNDM